MNNDFKKAGYFSAFAIFIIGIAALVISTIASYFAYDAIIILVGQLVSLIAFLGLLIVSAASKHKYNKACVRFAEYIINNRKKEAERNALDAERAREFQSIQTAAALERDQAVAAALEQGRNEGMAHAMQTSPRRMVSAPVETCPGYVQQISPADEVLYNEYGEPVMIRRRVKKQRVAPNNDVQYDRYGKPVSEATAPPPPPAPAYTPTSSDNQIYTPTNSDNQIYTPTNSDNQIYTPKSEQNSDTDQQKISPQPINVDPYRIDL